MFKIRLISLFIVFSFVLSSFIFVGLGDGPVGFKKNNVPVISGFKFEFINGRFFLYKEPMALSPVDGYPVLVLLHGATQHAFSWVYGLFLWNRRQTSFTYDALNEGFFILSLESGRPIRPGPRGWDAFTEDVSENSDVVFVENVLSWLENSSFNVDMDNVFCAGFSSGAFMCSRLGQSIGHRFKGLVLNSGCNIESINMTDRGPVFDCEISQNISCNHPSTLIVHGKKDSLVPFECANLYYNDLQNASVDSELIVDDDMGHWWLSDYNSDILSWLINHIE